MRFAVPVVLLAALWAVFQQSLSGQFVYDDLLLIQRNPALRSFEHWPQYFSSAYWDFTAPADAARIGYWRPLSALALACGHALDGGAPFGFRLLSLLVHSAAALAALALARRLGLGPLAAGAAAALYALHPVQVEAVAWPSSINDPLLALFVFLALLAHIRWRNGGSRGLPLLTGLWFAAALLVKEPAVALLVLLPAVDRGLRARRDAGGAAPPAPRWPLVATLGAVTVAYCGARLAVFGEWTGGLGRTTTALELTAARSALLRVEILGDALSTLVWPFDLQVFRPLDPQRHFGDAESLVELSWCLAFLALGLLLWRRRRADARPWIGWCLIAAPLLPLWLRLESLGQFPLTDRYLVLPAAGLGLWLGGAVQRWPRAASAPALALLVACAWASHRRVPVWLDEETLFRTAVAETPQSALPHWSLGRVLLERYRQGGTVEHGLLQRAEEAFTAAQELSLAASRGEERALLSSDDVLQANLGFAWCQLFLAPLEGYGDYQTPIDLFEAQLAARPESAEGWVGLGTALAGAGQGARAAEALERALALDPTQALAHFNLGRVHYDRGAFDLARAAFERTLELRSGRVQDHLWAARAAVEGGRLDLARPHLAGALALAPEDVEARVLAAQIALRRGDAAEALEEAERALRSDPSASLAHSERAKALLRLGQDDEALLAFRRACDFGPQYFEPHYNVAALLQARGAHGAALPYLQRAYQLCPDPAVRTDLRGGLARSAEHDPQLLLLLLDTDLGRRDHGPASHWGERLVELVPDDVEHRRKYASALRALGRMDEAVEQLAAGRDLAPEQFAVQRDYALALVAAERWESAAAELQRALELLPAPEQVVDGERLVPELRRELEQALSTLPVGPFPAPPR
jgi:tetratricopeptide (TPR) repeat protein